MLNTNRDVLDRIQTLVGSKVALALLDQRRKRCHPDTLA